MCDSTPTTVGTRATYCASSRFLVRNGMEVDVRLAFMSRSLVADQIRRLELISE